MDHSNYLYSPKGSISISPSPTGGEDVYMTGFAVETILREGLVHVLVQETIREAPADKYGGKCVRLAFYTAETLAMTAKQAGLTIFRESGSCRQSVTSSSELSPS